MSNQTKQTPLSDLRKDALKHYDEVSFNSHSHNSEISKAINFYYDHLERKEEYDFTLELTRSAALVLFYLVPFVFLLTPICKHLQTSFWVVISLANILSFFAVYLHNIFKEVKKNS